jgi:hypothetical protein
LSLLLFAPALLGKLTNSSLLHPTGLSKIRARPLQHIEYQSQRQASKLAPAFQRYPHSEEWRQEFLLVAARTSALLLAD